MSPRFIAGLLGLWLAASASAETVRVRVYDYEQRPQPGMVLNLYVQSPYQLITSATTDSNGYAEIVDNAFAGQLRCVEIVKQPLAVYLIGNDDQPLSQWHSPKNLTCRSNFSSLIVMREKYEMSKSQAVAVVGGARGYVNVSAGETAHIVMNPGLFGTARVRILTAQGQQIWEQSVSVGPADREFGQVSIHWPAVDSSGRKVSSGIYLVQIQGAGLNLIRRVAVVRR